jgi:hypothetical protein
LSEKPANDSDKAIQRGRRRAKPPDRDEQALIAALPDAVPRLEHHRGRSFALSLIEFHHVNGYLTARQWPWVSTMIEKAPAPPMVVEGDTVVLFRPDAAKPPGPVPDAARGEILAYPPFRDRRLDIRARAWLDDLRATGASVSLSHRDPTRIGVRVPVAPEDCDHERALELKRRLEVQPDLRAEVIKQTRGCAGPSACSVRLFFDSCTAPVLASTLNGYLTHRDGEARHIADMPCGRHAADIEWAEMLRARRPRSAQPRRRHDARGDRARAEEEGRIDRLADLPDHEHQREHQPQALPGARNPEQAPQPR